MDLNGWILRPRDTVQVKCQDSYGKLLEMMNRLEEDIDPTFTPEQAQFFKTLIASLIDNVRSLKGEKKR